MVSTVLSRSFDPRTMCLVNKLLSCPRNELVPGQPAQEFAFAAWNWNRFLLAMQDQTPFPAIFSNCFISGHCTPPFAKRTNLADDLRERRRFVLEGAGQKNPNFFFDSGTKGHLQSAFAVENGCRQDHAPHQRREATLRSSQSLKRIANDQELRLPQVLQTTFTSLVIIKIAFVILSEMISGINHGCKQSCHIKYLGKQR